MAAKGGLAGAEPLTFLAIRFAIVTAIMAAAALALRFSRGLEAAERDEGGTTSVGGAHAARHEELRLLLEVKAKLLVELRFNGRAIEQAARGEAKALEHGQVVARMSSTAAT